MCYRNSVVQSFRQKVLVLFFFFYIVYLLACSSLSLSSGSLYKPGINVVGRFEESQAVLVM